MQKRRLIAAISTLSISLITGACVANNDMQPNGSTVPNPHSTSTLEVAVCGAKPNCVSSAAFQAPEDERPKWYIEPLGYENRTVSGETAFAILVRILEAEEIAIEAVYPVIHAVAETKIFGYKDDLTFILLEDQGLVHIRSESRVGHYDFGKNRRRLESIRNQFVMSDE